MIVKHHTLVDHPSYPSLPPSRLFGQEPNHHHAYHEVITYLGHDLRVHRVDKKNNMHNSSWYTMNRTRLDVVEILSN